jgi:hypothetical protein
LPDQPLRCLAVRVLKDVEGEIDNIEFEAFLNYAAGRHQWISTTEWLFVEPPLDADGFETRPVVLPQNMAVKAILADLTNAEPRILTDHQVTPAEGRKWRWVAFQIAPNNQGEGSFPWERINA